MATAAELGLEILRAAQLWRKTRVVLKRVLDSKSASDSARATAKRDYTSACDALEKLVARLDKIAEGHAVVRRKGKPLPWKEIFGLGAAVITTIDSALNADLAQAEPPVRARKNKRPPAGTVHEDGSIEAEVVDE